MFPPFNSHPLSSSVESPSQLFSLHSFHHPHSEPEFTPFQKHCICCLPFTRFPHLHSLISDWIYYGILLSQLEANTDFFCIAHHWKHHWLIIWSSIVLTWPGIEHLLIKVLILWPYSASPALTYHEQLVVGIIFMNSYLRKSLGWADLTKN